MMTSSIEQQKERVRTLLTEVISLFCKNTLMFDSELCIEGLIGITKDKTDLMLVSIKDIISSTVLPDDDVADVRSCDEYVSRQSSVQGSCIKKNSKDSVIVVKVEQKNPVEVISIDDSCSSGDVTVSRRHHKRHIERPMVYPGDTKKCFAGDRNGDVAMTYVQPTEQQNNANNVERDLADFHSGFQMSSGSLHLDSPRQTEPISQGGNSNRNAELTHQVPAPDKKSFDLLFSEVSAKYQCDICLRRFGVRQALEDHMQGVHLGTPRFLCPHCGKRFRFRSSLSYHKRKCLTNSQHVQSDPKPGWIYVSASSQITSPGSSLQSGPNLVASSGDSSQLPVFPAAETVQQQLHEQLANVDQENLLQQLCSNMPEQQCEEKEKNGAAADVTTTVSDVT